MMKVVGRIAHRITLLLILVFIGLLPYKSISCSCQWVGDFFDVAKFTKVIVKVEIISHTKNEHDFEQILLTKVKKIYKGKEFVSQKKLLFKGDGGASCAPYVSHFKIGKEYIIQYDTSEIHSQDKPIISLCNCGEFYLGTEIK
jgi:hypothetical protein